MDSETDDSNSSASPSHLSLSHGLLECLLSNNAQYYTFSCNGEEFGAKGWKLNRGREDFDWMYTFHCHKQKKKKSNRSRNIHSSRKEEHGKNLIELMIKDDHRLALVGRMTASSSLCPNLNRYGRLGHTLETEFVLFGETAATQQSHDMTTSSSTSSPLNFFPRPSTSSSKIHSNSIDVEPIPGHISSSKHDIKKKMTLGHLLKSRSKDRHALTEEITRISNVSEEECYVLPSIEQEAIVIRSPFTQSKSVEGQNYKDTFSTDSGGWGLKFLEKISAQSRSRGRESVKDDSSKLECTNVLMVGSAPSLYTCTFDVHSLGMADLSCGEQEQTTVTVMVPADAHGLPAVKSCRPSSLIERWRFGGKCDCGGWDAGCNLTLFHNQGQNRDTLTAPCSEVKESDVFRLFKGKQQHTPVFEMVNVKNDLYLISFQSELSAVQVFAISLALLHGSDPVIKSSLSSNVSNDYVQGSP
ncbi:hypothetical protein SUGI_0319160 [Cryptomeria japonica]|nr:hypothetical protein SUGI_0319160 [Cryptomeria japonica]